MRDSLARYLSDDDGLGDDAVYAGDLPLLGCGIPSTSIAAGATTVVIVPVDVEFRPDLWFVSGAGLIIQGIKIRLEDQLVNQSGIPVAAFAANSRVSRLRGKTADPSVGIKLTVNNPTGGAVVIEGGIFGPAA